MIPQGTYEIQCVLLNSETVVNDDGVRELEIREDHWCVWPSGQRFELLQDSGERLILESNGHQYFAELELLGDASILVNLKKKNVAEVLSIEAKLIEAVLPVDHAVSPSW